MHRSIKPPSASHDSVGREIHEPDEPLLPRLTTVGNQIGMFIERQRAQEGLSGFSVLSVDMLCVAALDGYFNRVNPAWQNVLGYTEAELLSRVGAA